MPQRAKDILSEFGVRPSKSRGQSFLIDAAAIEEIVSFGRPGHDDGLIEIGPGLGALTRELFRFGRLTVIEIEEKFCADLQKRFPGIVVINEDVRSVDFAELGSDLVVFGNLPYSFSTDIVFHLVEYAAVIKRAVLMLQREFAERLAAAPGGRDYGVLSISAQLWAEIDLGPIITGQAFHPPPRVDSQLVNLRFSKQPRAAVGDLFWFKRVVAAAFFQRRRKIANSMRAAGAFEGKHIDLAFERAGIDPGRRAETLSIAEYAALSNALMRTAPEKKG
jgi:16S rRNA (adenine1518-N6/adenine1519-N6)-dimethyltransferase